MRKIIYEIIGWYGVCAIIAAYFLVSYSLLAPTNLFYQMLNLSGACGIVISSLRKKDYQPVALNATWMLIALFAIINMLFP